MPACLELFSRYAAYRGEAGQLQRSEDGRFCR